MLKLWGQVVGEREIEGGVGSLPPLSILYVMVLECFEKN